MNPDRLNFEPAINRITGKTNAMGIIEQVKQMRIEEAREEERNKNRISFVRKLVTGTKFSDEKIADLVGVSEAFVRRIRRGIK